MLLPHAIPSVGPPQPIPPITKCVDDFNPSTDEVKMRSGHSQMSNPPPSATPLSPSCTTSVHRGPFLPTSSCQILAWGFFPPSSGREDFVGWRIPSCGTPPRERAPIHSGRSGWMDSPAHPGFGVSLIIIIIIGTAGGVALGVRAQTACWRVVWRSPLHLKQVPVSGRGHRHVDICRYM